MNKLKVVHFSSVHRADDPRVFDKECRSLADAGYDVTLIARADTDVDVHGVSIRAFERPRGGNKITRILRTTWRMLHYTLREKGDVYHFHDPELLHVGVLLRLSGKRVIYDSHETTKKQLRTAGWIHWKLRPLVANGVGVVERLATQTFNGVVAATPAIAANFQPSKTEVVQNFPRLDGPLGDPPPDDYLSREPVVAYVGTMNPLRGLFEMIQAMDLLADATGVELALGGSFPTETMRERAVATSGWERVNELGWLDRQAVAGVLHRSRVGLLVLHPAPNYMDSYPVKLFEYMLAGIPVVSSDIPFWQQFVSEIGSGIMVDPKDPTAIASAIKRLLDDPVEVKAMGQRGRLAVLNRYSWEHEADRLLSLYRNVLVE